MPGEGVRACNPFVLAFGWMNSSTILLIVHIGARVLAGVHRLHRQRLQAVVHTLHERMEKSRLEDVEQLNLLLASMLNEERYVRTIPSWRWKPGVLTRVLTAILLPLVISPPNGSSNSS